MTASESPAAPPAARVVPARRPPWAWIPPLLALLLVAWAGWTSWRGRGTPVTVTFQHGHGIKPGDALRYRGIVIGEVRAVSLDDELTGVVVEAVLDDTAEDVARQGSRFWVVRPQIGLSGVEGIETVVGARYLAVQPGDPEAPRARAFAGLEEPPVRDAVEPGSLQLVLEARRRGSLRRGAPLTYRGIQVGEVLDVDLASDATSLEVEAYVRPEYATLVRGNTRFWDAGGLDLDVGLSGLALEIDSLATLVAGGVALATPDDPGAPVADGHRFPLDEDPEESWLEWRPPLPLGAADPRAPADLPRPVPVSLTWQEGRILRSDEARSGWGVVLVEGLVVPADLLAVPSGAREGTGALEVGGRRLELPFDAPAFGADARLRVVEAPPGARPWPAELVRRLGAPEDCLLVSAPDVPPAALAANRLEPDSSPGWRVDDAIALPAARHGAAVVGRRDGQLVGVLWVGEDGARVLPLVP